MNCYTSLEKLAKENCVTRVSRRCEKALMERNAYKRAPLKILETKKFDRGNDGIFDPSDFYETRNRFFAYVIVRDCTSVTLPDDINIFENINNFYGTRCTLG